MMAALARRRNDVFALLVLGLIVTAISAPVYAHRILTPTDNDYGTHIQFAIDLLQRKDVPAYTLAHPMMQALIIGILWITRGKVGLWLGSVVVLVAAQVLTAWILYLWFGQLSGKWGGLQRAFWAVTLTLAAPIMALVFMDGQYYFGYIGLASYHNPTVHLLRPLALVSFFFAVRALDGARSPAWMAVVSAVVIVLSALIKPNYALVILPALALLTSLGWLRKQPVDWRLVWLGFVLPAALTLAVQGAVTYAGGRSIIFAPLVVESIYSGYLLPKFLLSIVFPLCLLWLDFSGVRASTEMRLAWAAFGAGILQVYLLAESGDRLLHGNFRWSAQIGLFLLFAASARHLLRCLPLIDPAALRRRAVITAAYLAHVGAGIIYYVRAFTTSWYG